MQKKLILFIINHSSYFTSINLVGVLGFETMSCLLIYLCWDGYPRYSNLLRKVREGYFISSFKVGGRSKKGVEIFHLLFIDDILLFCKHFSDQVIYMSQVLFWFEASSGLRISLDKSELILVGDVPNVEELSFLLVIGRESFNYLLRLILGIYFQVSNCVGCG